MTEITRDFVARYTPRGPVAPLPAPSTEALALQARLGLRLADINTAADRSGLLNALARGLVRLTVDTAGDAIAVRSRRP